jgi:dye decolorizing peroxidase
VFKKVNISMVELDRRALLVRGGLASGLAATGAIIAGCTTPEAKNAAVANTASTEQADTETFLKDAMVPFDGKHQAGITASSHAVLNLLGFNLKDTVGKKEFTNLMRLWTADARALCTSETPVGSLEPEMADTPANLTITCGLGERVFDVIGAAKLRPKWLRDVEAFDRDKLDPAWGQTDIVLQICCDDPVTAGHAMRHMIRAGQDYAQVKWLQQGYGHAYGAGGKGDTPRNHFGQLDGTVNPRGDEEMDQQVWIDEGPQWARGGTSMVVRRIRMNLDTWEKLDRKSRENSIGRKLDNGAPLTGEEEFDKPDFDAVDKYGLPTIDRNSHIARAQAPDGKPQERMLRRAFNYDMQPDYAPISETGFVNDEEEISGTDVQLSNSGLVFICFQKDMSKVFEPMQRRMDEVDLLNEWITHIGSAVYFVPPGVQSGGTTGTFWAETLIDAVG